MIWVTNWSTSNMLRMTKVQMVSNHLHSCWLELRCHALRSTLTTIGIVFAVAGVISIVALTAGLDHSLVKNFNQLGSDTLIVRQNIFKALNREKLQPMAEREWHALQNLQPGISAVATFSRVQLSSTEAFGTRIRYQQQSHIGSLLATSANLPEMIGRYPIAGRFYADSDSDARRRVCLVSEELAEKFNFNLSKMSQIFLQIGSYQLQVIGIMPGGSRDIIGTSADVYLPLGLAKQLSDGPLEMNFGFRSLDPLAAARITDEVKQLLRQIQNTRPNENSNFVIESAEAIKKMETDMLDTVRRVLLLVVAISLVVGCIGIVNVMLASVSERTREIGLLRALGASQAYIQSRVLVESALLCSCGAGVGIALGYGMAAIIATTIPQIGQAILPPSAVLLTVLSAIVVGLLCAVLPARKAAALSPLTALNME